MTEKFSVKARLHSMRFAINGLKILWTEQHNARVHFAATVVEYLCDKVSAEYDPLIGKAKDVAAAGVLIAAAIAVFGGFFLFVSLI